jgi:hypothetical protein
MLKQLATSDNDGSMRRAVVQELARGWKDDPNTSPMLKQWAIREAIFYPGGLYSIIRNDSILEH